MIVEGVVGGGSFSGAPNPSRTDSSVRIAPLARYPVSSLMRDMAIHLRGECFDRRRQAEAGHLSNSAGAWRHLVESQFTRAQLLAQRLDLISQAAHFRCGREPH